MSHKTFVIIIIALIVLALVGIGIIVVPPLLQDSKLNKDAEEYDDLLSQVRVTDSADETTALSTEAADTSTLPSETEQATPTETPTADVTPTETPTETSAPTETQNVETTPPTESEEPSETPEAEESSGAPEGWNPFGDVEKKKNSLFESKTEEENGNVGNGLRYGPYSDNPDDISPVDNPDKYNAWLQDKYKTPTPSPKPTPAPTPSPVPRVGGNTGVDMASCLKINPEFIAWIKIPGTNIDYPVVQTNNTDYYLDHTFEGKKSDLGTLFSLGKCNWRSPSKNVVIYGHHVEGSGYKMFKALLKYKDKSYFDQHPIIYLDSVYADGRYKIFAVFDITEGDIDPSRTSFGSNAEFLDFVYAAKDLSFYNTGVVLNEEDHIISLVTCDKYFKRGVGRLVVMAVKI